MQTEVIFENLLETMKTYDVKEVEVYGWYRNSSTCEGLFFAEGNSKGLSRIKIPFLKLDSNYILYEDKNLSEKNELVLLRYENSQKMIEIFNEGVQFVSYARTHPRN